MNLKKLEKDVLSLLKNYEEAEYRGLNSIAIGSVQISIDVRNEEIEVSGPKSIENIPDLIKSLNVANYLVRELQIILNRFIKGNISA